MSGVQAVPAPWNLKGRVWAFALSSLSKTGSFPAGFAAPHEAEALTSGGEFIGGPGLIQVSLENIRGFPQRAQDLSPYKIISYSASPVGPYDELIYLPGRWKYSDGTAGYRITRIYVSSKESTENGRRNWNIPKQVADFDIKTHNRASVITVSHLGASAPFFRVTIKPVPLLSYLPIPFNTHSLGQYFTLVQPPLPAGRRPEEVATTQWAALLPAMKGTVRLASITPGIGGKVGDGEGFPALVPWSVGGHMADVGLDFGVPSLSDSR